MRCSHCGAENAPGSNICAACGAQLVQQGTQAMSPSVMPAYMVVSKSPGHSVGVASLVIGILSIIFGWIPFFGFVLPLIGIILAIVSMVKSQNAGCRIEGVATAGLICSIIGLMFAIIITIVVVVEIAVEDEFDSISSRYYSNYYRYY